LGERQAWRRQSAQSFSPCLMAVLAELDLWLCDCKTLAHTATCQQRNNKNYATTKTTQ
jgi:hypothetical protein